MEKVNRWDIRFLELARHVAGWSKDPVNKVGCVIVKGNAVVSLGYNGFPKGMKDDERLNDKDEKWLWTIHAEENAILAAREPDLQGCTAYVWPLHPCTRCAAKLAQAGVARIVANEPTARHSEKYQLEKVEAMLGECGVVFKLINLEKMNDN